MHTFRLGGERAKIVLKKANNWYQSDTSGYVYTSEQTKSVHTTWDGTGTLGTMGTDATPVPAAAAAISTRSTL